MGTALAGAMVNRSGSRAASALDRMVAKGVTPNSAALSADIRTRALAPSFKVLALAAVTDPSLSKTGRRVGIFSSFTLRNSSSSVTMTGSPFR